MLTEIELVHRLFEQKYMPGWRIHGIIDREGPAMVIRATVLSSVDPTETTDLRIVTYVPPMRTLQEVDQFVHWRLERMAIHEVAEWHRVNGHPVEAARHAT